MTKQVIVHAPFDVRLDELPSDERPLGPYELRVRTELTALSPGTETRIYTGQEAERFAYRVRYPMPIGYNNVGRIVEVGSEVREYQVGGRIFSRMPHIDEYIVAERVFAAPPPAGSRPAPLAAFAEGSPRPEFAEGRVVGTAVRGAGAAPPAGSRPAPLAAFAEGRVGLPRDLGGGGAAVRGAGAAPPAGSRPAPLAAFAEGSPRPEFAEGQVGLPGDLGGGGALSGGAGAAPPPLNAPHGVPAANVPANYGLIAPVPDSVPSEHAVFTHLFTLGLPMAVAQLSFQARAARLQLVAGRPQGPS
jgi:hypothetical protein